MLAMPGIFIELVARLQAGLNCHIYMLNNANLFVDAGGRLRRITFDEDA
jgi:hypothetical protein